MFDGFEAAPRATAVDVFGFEEAVDRLGKRIVITVADAADRGLDARFGQSLGDF